MGSRESPRAVKRDALRRAIGWRAARVKKRLEQVPKKLTDFFDENLLRRFDFERLLIDHMIRCDREALQSALRKSGIRFFA
ncbi:hypothetical protein V3H18_02850 [Methylocystis sp. 9N]|uniref:FAD assembly factor SdhE n=1 Tax=Methylocystis borbori TaxID=3118750 RepID=A0ABU7XEI9_9HYPH